MFGLFKKTKVKEEEIVLPDIKITEMIYQFMTLYLEQSKKDSALLVENSEDLEEELKRLERLGLGNSENAKLLKTRIEETEAKREKMIFGKEVMKWIQQMKTVFPSSYLVSFDQFCEILKKYGLVTGFLKDYTGIIPNSNILEVEKVMDVLNSERFKNRNPLFLNLAYHEEGYSYNFFYFVRGVSYRRNDERKDCEIIRKVLEDHGNLISRASNSGWGEEHINLKRVEDLNFKGVIESSVDDFELKVERIDDTELMIAAPRENFSTEFQVSQLPVDPIVFQCCPYGIVIHSVWGEEADDKVLENYKKLNQDILG